VIRTVSPTRFWPFAVRERPSREGAILIVDHHVLEFDRNAGDLYMLQYMTVLLEHGFKVLYMAHDHAERQPYAAQLQQLGVETLFGSFDESAWFRSHGRHLRWVMLARPDMAASRLATVRRHTDATVIYYTHDLHFLRERRLYELTGSEAARLASERFLEVERSLCRDVDVVATPSSDELPEVRALGARQAVVWPPHYENLPEQAGPPPGHDVLFVGGFGHPPNIDAAKVLANEIMPIVWKSHPSTRLLIVGNGPPPEVTGLAGPRTVVTGFVPELGPYYAQARVSVNALRYGAGLKGKIVASLAAGIPVVTTDIGNEGIGLIDGQDGLIGRTPAELAAGVVRLLEDDAFAERVSRAGHLVVEERFSRTLTTRAILDTLGVQTATLRGASVGLT
jgi:glycosyltransferase involved in cell wall biosynthesis